MTKQRKGFTLVELSIVLIIIGLIIGGVLKGTDLINSAKQKKFYNTFVKGWQVAANQYQDRTGQILGDAAVNGGVGGAAALDGIRETRNLATTNTVRNRLIAVGIDVPVTSTNNSGSYVVEGKLVSQTVQGILNFQAVNGSTRNVFQMNNVPTDVALALDTMIDGTADAGLGDCRQNIAAGLANTTLAWPNASTTTTVNMTILF